jgi:hypothetical protein
MNWPCFSDGPATTAVRILNAKPEDRGNRGRHELRWEDGVDNDVKAQEERNRKKNLILYFSILLHYCLVVRVPGYRSRGPGFDSRRYQTERDPLSLVRIIEELLE